MKCGKCGSTRVVPRARVIDRGDYGVDNGNVRVGVLRKPLAILFKGKETADMHARVCGDCGFVELFVEDAESIYSAYEESRS